jgi:hypothetical protein
VLETCHPPSQVQIESGWASGPEEVAFGQALAICYTVVAFPRLGEQSLDELKIRNDSFTVTKHESQSFLDRVSADLPLKFAGGGMLLLYFDCAKVFLGG